MSRLAQWEATASQRTAGPLSGPTRSAPQLVSRPDIHIGFNPTYEHAALPDTASVVEAVRLVME
ncbi:MAG: hypothetical protein WD066_07950 [Planctomycetaceae bacterium]